jgi:cytochrome c553
MGLLAAAVLLFAHPGAAEPEKLDVCAVCHGDDGVGEGFPFIPIIAGTPAAHLEEALFAYKDGDRRCVGVPVMCEIVMNISDDEITELAKYYSRMPRVSSGEDFDPDLAAAGKIIHDRQCAVCHVMPDDPQVDSALGIPLHGQRAAYLRLALGAYLTGDRKTLVPEMEKNIRTLDTESIEALANYYSSYAP